MFDYKGFMRDFRIADQYGEEAIKDTYKRAKEGWKNNVKYFASLVMTLNHQSWNWYEKGDDKLGELYNDLWMDADAWGSEHFTGEDANYYFSFLD